MQKVALVIVSALAIFFLTTDSSFERSVGGLLRSSGASVTTEATAVSKDASQSLFSGLESLRLVTGEKLIAYRESLRRELPPVKKDTPVTSYLLFFGTATLAFFFIYKILFYAAIVVVLYLIFNLIRYRKTY